MRSYFYIRLNPKSTMCLWFRCYGLRWHVYNRGWGLLRHYRSLNLGRLSIDY